MVMYFADSVSFIVAVVHDEQWTIDNCYVGTRIDDVDFCWRSIRVECLFQAHFRIVS